MVEDERLIAIAQAEALTEAGFLVHPVSDGASALAVAKAVGLSAVIIDMGLPDCSGDHVARVLRARHPSLPILICTNDSAGLSEESGAIGVCIVQKPIDDAVLVSTLREHMRRVSHKIPPVIERSV